MPELEAILDLAEHARRHGEAICLVTVVGVEGSSYRKPGTRMLLTSGGLRAGTISGGCLESEVTKKAWWLTEDGPSLQRYASFFDEDAGVPYGLGCGGTVFLLLERGPAAEAVLEALRLSVRDRQQAAVITGLQEDSPGTRLVMNAVGEVLYAAPELCDMGLVFAEKLARQVLSSGANGHFQAHDEEPGSSLFCERITPPPALWIFGAGDDAQPLVEIAYNLDWQVTVADGRSHLARAERFPHAHRVLSITRENSESIVGEIRPDDAVVLMTHSYEQDRELLGQLLPLPLGYLGLLGPRLRTRRILKQITKPGTGSVRMTVDEARARLHSPIGLNISAYTPAAIALSIAAEVQSVLSARAIGGEAVADHPSAYTEACGSSHAS